MGWSSYIENCSLSETSAGVAVGQCYSRLEKQVISSLLSNSAALLGVRSDLTGCYLTCASQSENCPAYSPDTEESSAHAISKLIIHYTTMIQPTSRSLIQDIG